MKEQPEALRLADLVDHGSDSSHIEREVVSELRRLHAVNAELLEALDLIVTIGAARDCDGRLSLDNADDPQAATRRAIVRAAAAIRPASWPKRSRT